MTKLPSLSVRAPRSVPCTATEAPAIGAALTLSTTVPRMVRSCACAVATPSARSIVVMPICFTTPSLA